MLGQKKTIATQQAHKDWSKKYGKQEKFIYLVDNKLILSINSSSLEISLEEEREWSMQLERR